MHPHLRLSKSTDDPTTRTVLREPSRSVAGEIKEEAVGNTVDSIGRFSGRDVSRPTELRLSADGQLLAPTGGDEADEDWASVVAYASQLGGLIGELMGLEGFRGLDCHFKDKRWLIAQADSGELRAVRVRNQAEADTYRARWGLL